MGGRGGGFRRATLTSLEAFDDCAKLTAISMLIHSMFNIFLISICFLLINFPRLPFSRLMDDNLLAIDTQLTPSERSAGEVT